MKYILTFLALAFSGTLIAQSNNIEDYMSQLNTIKFWDASNGMTIGQTSLLSTQDGGVSWSRYDLKKRFSSPKPLMDIEIVNSGMGVAVGGSGLVLHTSNNGVSWEKIPLIEGNEEVTGLTFYNGVGYMVGYQDTPSNDDPFIYKSTDNGLSWNVLPSNLSSMFFSNGKLDLEFINETTGILWYGGSVYRSNDSGITWQLANGPDNGYIDKIQFLDEFTWFANSGGDVYRTDDAGNSWVDTGFYATNRAFTVNNGRIHYGQYISAGNGVLSANLDGSDPQTVFISQNGKLKDLYFVDDNVGYLIGSIGSSESSLGRFIYKTIDGGLNWTPIDNCAIPFANIIVFDYIKEVMPEKYLIHILSGSGNANCYVATSNDDGASWQIIKTFPEVTGKLLYAEGNYISHVRYADPNNSANGVIYSESQDGGLTWVDGPILFTPLDAFYYWRQTSETDLFIHGGTGIYYSDDKGDNWVLHLAPAGTINRQYEFSDKDNGFMYAENDEGEPVVYRTFDGGQTWVFLFELNGYSHSLQFDDFDFSNANQLVLSARYPGYFIHLYDTETNTLESKPVDDPSYQVKIIDVGNIVLLKNDFELLETEDGANTWNTKRWGGYSIGDRPQMHIQNDGSIIMLEDNFIQRISDYFPDTPDFFVGDDTINVVGITESYFLPVDEFAETEWELITGGNLILDSSTQNYKAEVEWLAAGVHTIRARRINDSGASSYVELQVTVDGVIDSEPPNVITQDISVELGADGTVTIAPELVDNGSTDNVTNQEDLVFTLDMSTFDCSVIGSNIVTLTVTDQSGNSASDTAVVIVQDLVDPNTISQDLTRDLEGNSSITILASEVDNGSSDNCQFSLSIDVDTFTSPGVYPILLTAVDGSGNFSNETATVTIFDSTLGINDPQDTNISFYPNPVKDILIIENTSNTEISSITVYDFLGRLVLLERDDFSLVDVSSLKPGLFFLKIEAGRSVLTKKIIKE